ncbi:DNA-binding SARP family transcriptional activator [Nonomuraea polychroma]|uniref:DNA-binding SARP family transcriptional activator n=1 Tax=Nonomuraea polychroma TaxID=46176 RepID=A0A438M040_9ACTN|nr:AfsR/SARP family transcriptional regulator [Nonomuraea polychroma]RVX38858.1 DNA-binding SARP family transcriptional activator [Nonomuraea polychroma]
MRFGILGQPAIWRHDQEIRLATRRSRAVLAHLLLSPARSASIESLIYAIYGDAPTKSARNQVHRGVGELRKYGVTIDVHDNVYRLEAAEDTIDAFVFMRLYDQARLLAGDRDHAGAATMLGEALALWRGSALSGLDSEAFLAEAAVWDERRLTAIEARIDADLALGRHREVIAELQQLADQHPLREAFCGQLMLALYRSQRGSEALQAFTDLEDRLREELGTDPSPALRDLRTRILRQDSALDLWTRIPPQDSSLDLGTWIPQQDSDSGAPVQRQNPGEPAPPPVPRQLPARSGALVGRDAELRRITDAMDDHGTCPVVVVTGPGGVGKTALCLEAAHRVAVRYPDGQLYADDLSEPGDVLAAFLTALGAAAGEIPDGMGARAALLRSLLAGRRVLIVLDGVSGARHIDSFVPGHPGCAVLVTSRSPLALLQGAVRVPVSALDRADARALLATGAGEERMAAEPDAADRIIDLCARLPVALHIAAARLATRPHWTLARLAERLADPAKILSELRHDGQSVVPTLMRGYEVLPAGPRSLIRRIGFYGSAEVTARTTAALADVPMDVAENMLEELAESHFMVTLRDGARFRCHELLLGFGAGRALAEDPEEDLRAAVQRALGGWLTLTDAAHTSMRGQDNSIPRGTAPRYQPRGAAAWSGEGAAWFDANLEAILAAVRRAVPFPETCWELAVAPLARYEAGSRFDEWLESHELALSSVRGAGNIRGEAALLYSLGYRSLLVGDYAGAARRLEEALRLFQHLADDHGRGLALRLLADLDRIRQEPAKARRTYEEAAEVLRRSGDPVGEADALGGLAMVLHSTGEEQASQECLERALVLCREGGSLRSEAQIRRGVAMHAARAGTPEEAYPELLQALEIATFIGDRVVLSDILLDLGTTRILLGDPRAAYDNLVTAEEIAKVAGVKRTALRARRARAFLNGNGEATRKPARDDH